MITRCSWAQGSEAEQNYHDNEWGKPVYDDRLLFEFLILEGAQAGLSWITILNKRDNYRQVFDNFEPNLVALYQQDKIDELLKNPGIVRNKLKVNSTVKNAKAFLNIQQEFGSFSDYLWSFVSGQPIQNSWVSKELVPASTELSDKLSKDLKKRGFSFVGTTICYSLMQAVGLINDHTTDCFRHQQLTEK